jgi:hypothetical protein
MLIGMSDGFRKAALTLGSMRWAWLHELLPFVQQLGVSFASTKPEAPCALRAFLLLD